MARKPPKSPVPVAPPPQNNNAKSIDRWDDEGGAPGRSQYRRKRLRDLNQWARRMVDLATGTADDEPAVKKRRQPPAKASKAVKKAK